MKYLKLFEDIDFDDKFLKLRNDFVWSTKEGRRIKLKNITNSQLNNLIPYVQKHIKVYGKNRGKNLIEIFTKELKYRENNSIFESIYRNGKNMKKKMKNDDFIDLLFIPSGEIIKITFQEYDMITSYFIELDYNEELGYWCTDDIRLDMIKLIIQNTRG